MRSRTRGEEFGDRLTLVQDGQRAAGVVAEFVVGIDGEHVIDCTEHVFGTQGAIERRLGRGGRWRR